MMTENDNGRDDFWDVDKLVPKKKTSMRPFVTRPIATDYSVSGEPLRDTSKERKLNFEHMSSDIHAEEKSYIPENMGLIKRVTIRRFNDRYDFYGNFRKAALIYYDYKTDRCDFAPYYSYMPQYSQLTSAQKNYYFFWRDMVRRGKYIKSDYSYVYLYVYEILNLPDKIPPEQGIKMLCRLWREYRDALPRIDSYFSIWVQDYCLVYSLPCPLEMVRDFIFDVIEASDFKEFYLSDISELGSCGVETLVAYLSYYDWRRGKFAAGDNAEIYRTHMQGAMRHLLEKMYRDGKISGGTPTLIRRDAFAHSLCTHAVKCKLEIEYTPLSGDESLRRSITGAVRYTENKLRALFGIKSRLAVKELPEEYKRDIDVYFDGLFEAQAAKRARESLPEYERLYDVPRETLSFAGADEIERASWVTTARLVADAVDETENTEGSIQDEICKNEREEDQLPVEEDNTEDTYGLGADEISALSAVYNNECRLTDDALAERINDAFSDAFGDVILESDGESYTVIEDYREEIGNWLLKIMR